MAFAALMGAIGSCTGTETGNPPFRSGVAYALHASDPNVAGVEQGPAIVVTQAWLSASRVAFVPGDDCTDPRDAVEVQGASTIDLRSAPRAVFDTTARHFCSVRIDLQPASAPLPNMAPEALLGRTLFVAGRRADGTPFVYASDQTASLEMRTNGEPFTLDELRPDTLIALDVSILFSDVDLDGADVAAGGTIYIDSTSNAPLRVALDTATSRASTLFRDEDRNGLLSHEEAANAIASGAH